MTDLPILRDLGMILVGAVLAVLLARRLAAPSIVAYLAAGLVLGPVTGLLAGSESVDLIAEIGIVLLLFLVGLELDLERVRVVGKVVVASALVQLGLTVGGAYLLSLLLGFGSVEALFIAVALAFSSTVVVVKLLDQKGLADSLSGRIAIGILLIQDVAVILSLTFLAGFGGEEGAGGAATIARDLLVSFAGMGGLIAAAVLASRHFLPRVMRWASSALEVLFIWSLAWCFLFVVAAEAMELSVEIGAFLAGLSLAPLPYNHELRRRVHPLTSFFLAVFFVSLGVHMELGAALARWEAVLALSLFVVVGKWLMVTAAATRFGPGGSAAFRAGVALSQISEFSFILATLGVEAGHIDAPILSVIGAVGLLTIGASSYLIQYDEGLYRRARGWGLPDWLGGGAAEEEAEPSRPRGHIIVVGVNSLGARIVRGLLERGEEVVAVDSDPRKLEGLPCRTVLGNAEHLSVLHDAGLADGRLLVSALQIEDANNLLAFRGREAGVPTSIHAFDQAVVQELREIGADHLIFSKSAGIRHLARVMRGTRLGAR